MCTGRVDLEFVIQSFLNGADGVFIGGCRLNECNYTTQGNYDALNMVLLCKRLMEHTGLNPERLRIDFMSSGEGNLFAEVMNAFSKTIHRLGPLGIGEGLDETKVQTGFRELIELVPYIKLMKNDKLGSRIYAPEDYDNLFTLAEIEQLLQEAASYYIDPALCQACGMCFHKCPVSAIEGGKGLVHIIDQKVCIKCGSCYASCPPRIRAIRKIIDEPVPPPVAQEARKIPRISRRA